MSKRSEELETLTAIIWNQHLVSNGGLKRDSEVSVSQMSSCEARLVKPLPSPLALVDSYRS